MFGPILIGALAALVVALPHFASSLFGTGLQPFDSRWGTLAGILGVTAAAVLIQRFVISRKAGARSYDGVTDLLVHIHSPAEPDSPFRWFSRGAISALFAMAGAPVGPEGAATEMAHAAELKARPNSARWFEQRRRTDAAVALAAGISAAFGAPFAGLLVPIELGIGGRTWSIALASLSAFLFLEIFGVPAPLSVSGLFISFAGTFSGVSATLAVLSWVQMILLGAIVGVSGYGLIRFLEFSKSGLNGTFPGKVWLRMAVGGCLLALLVLAYRSGLGSLPMLLQDLLWERFSVPAALLILAAQVLGLALVVGAFGTIGVLWPIFLIGGLMGFVVHGVLSATGVLGFGPELSALSTLAGSSAIWASVFGAPLAGAVLCFELTRNPAVLLPCLAVALIARQLRGMLSSRAWFQQELIARGVSLIEGRSAAVLDSVLVRDAMVDDFETVQEQESVSDLYLRLMKSRYPFFPMIGTDGSYLGMITADMIQDGWRAQDPLTSNSPLSKLLEAKDLLYRSGLKTGTTLKPETPIRETSHLFEEMPCIPVVNEKKQVVGLLFAYSVRLAYEREAARRSLALAASTRAD